MSRRSQQANLLYICFISIIFHFQNKKAPEEWHSSGAFLFSLQNTGAGIAGPRIDSVFKFRHQAGRTPEHSAFC